MSLKSQMLGFFLVFCLITTVTFIPMNIHYFNKKEEITSTVQGLYSFRADLLHVLLLQSDFLNYDTRSTNFFKTNKSIYLDSLYIQQKHLYDKINFLTQACKENNLIETNLLEQVKTELFTNSTIFDKMVTAIYRRGFKDWGTEGQMRDQVHLLENFNEIDQRDVLSLRRHEKDYMIRNDSIYVNQLNELSAKMQRQIAANKIIQTSSRDAILVILSNYNRLFNKLVALDNEIGLRSKQGLNQQLLQKDKNIEILLSKIQAEITIKKEQLIHEIEIAYALSCSILLLISLALGWFISGTITRPILELTESITQLIHHNFQQNGPIVLKTNQQEINILADEFNNMINQLQIHENERLKAQGELFASEKKYRDMLEWLPQGVFELDLTETLIYANQAMRKKLRLTDEDLNSTLKLSDFIVEPSKNDEVSDKNEIIAKRTDQSTFHALLYTSPIQNKQKIVGQRGVIIDISERHAYLRELQKEKAKAEESDRLKSAFLANMSHEIRTPMNAIIGFSEIIKDPKLSHEERLEFISHINTNGESLLNLIEDIIDIAKIESGHIRINPAATNITDILRELEISLHEIQKQQGNEEVKLLNECTENSLAVVMTTDPFRLRQVLINLLTNALKFTEKGSIRFGYQINSEKNTILFYVKDTGIGIPQDKQEIIFERFRKVYNYDTKHYRGTGLGLYISKTILNHMGGDIWLDSQYGKGSTFYFNLPFHPVVPSEITTPKPQSHSNYSIDNIRVLIAEDQEFNYLLLKTILEKKNAQVFHVKNGIEMMDFFFDKNVVDIALVDLHMPRMTGYEAIPKLKKLIPGLPIIVQTANAMAGEREKCFELGADEYISKPVNQDVLIEKIAFLVAQYSSLNCKD